MSRGNDLSGNGVAVTVRGGAITLFGMNKLAGSCDAYIALPTRYLGSSYYTMSHYPASKKTQVTDIIH